MNQKIRVSHAAYCLIGAVALLLFLMVWPGGLLKNTTVSKSDEVVAMESQAVNVEHNVTQMFVAQGTTLGAVDLYVCNDMGGETITFRLYDASYSELFNVFYQVKEGEKFPGFVHIPVGYDLTVDQEYYYTLEGLSADLYVNYEDTYASSSVANGTMSYAGEEFPGYNVIIRYEYTDALTLRQISLAAVILVFCAAVLIFLSRLLCKRKVIKDKEIKVQTVCKAVLTPVILFVTAISVFAVFPGRKFGTGAVNYAFYGMSILMLALFWLYWIYYERTQPPVSLPQENKIDTARGIDIQRILKRIPDLLQTVGFAGILWYCFDYMNGLYDISHSFSICKLMIWIALTLITTYRKEEILHIGNAVWLIMGSGLAYLYAKPYFGVEEQGKLYAQRAYLIVIGGFVILNTIMMLFKLIFKKIRGKRPNLWFSLLFILFLLSLVIMRNERLWPVAILLIMALSCFRVSMWENREHLLKNFTNGVLLNFGMMVCFCLWHRPYHYYIYYRYYMAYHTVTMTAVHLTLVMAAAGVKLFAKYQKDGRIRAVLPEMFLFGAAASYMIFTLSRTGYVAAAFMIIILLLTSAVFFDPYKKKWKGILKRTVILLLSVFYLFPITFTATRMVPALVRDPVIYEIEPRTISILKGTPSDSKLYIDIERFVKVFGSKILGVGEDVTGSKQSAQKRKKNETPETVPGEMMASANIDDLFAVTGTEWYFASSDGLYGGQEEEYDVSNGRMDIFREYIKAWNLTGHTQMGVPLADQTISTHAHNIYLQVIHDHGLIVGVYFIVFMAVAFVVSFIYVKRKKHDPYSLMIPAVLSGFLTAGLVEWIFHPCNPFGISVLIVMIPLVFMDKGEKHETEETV